MYSLARTDRKACYIIVPRSHLHTTLKLNPVPRYIENESVELATTKQGHLVELIVSR